MTPISIFKTTLLSSALLISSLYSAPVWQGKGRIAISSDGNEHDHDDWAATPFSLAIIAAKGIQDKLVLYTYSDHIWGSNKSKTNGLAEMRISALEGADQFGFDKSRFIEAVTYPDSAYNALRDQINASSIDDPLYIIGAGPMQVIGEGINRSDVNKRKFVHVISHSNWNDKHSDKPLDWEDHQGWTWDEMETAFSGDGMIFDHIEDQNGGTGYDGMKAVPTKFDWLKTSSARTHSAYKAGSWDWLYARQEMVVKQGDFDPSDAGMLIYFFTGIEKTEPSDAQAIMEHPVLGGNTTNPEVSCDKAYVEIESVEPVGDWTKETTIAGYNGEGYFYWKGGNNYKTPPANSILKYTVNLSEAGQYKLAIRGRRDQADECNGAASDECNDVYVKVNNGTWIKSMVKGTWGKWVWQAKFEPGHDGVINAEYDLTKGLNTIEITGRSEGVKLDAFSIYKSNEAMLTAPVPGCSSTPNDSIIPPTTDPLIIKAIEISDITLTGAIPFYVDAARGALAINAGQVDNRNEWAIAEFDFDGESGTYDIKLNTLTELDGESPYRVLVNGVVVGEFTNPETVSDYQGQSKTFTQITLNKGDVIQVQSQAVTNGKIIEGDGTAYSRGRWTSLEFTLNSSNEPTITDINDLTLKLESNQSITLNWSDIENEDGYRIRRKITSQSTYTNLTDLPMNSTQYVDTNVLPNTSYTYMVRPLQDNATPTFSNTPSIETGDKVTNLFILINKHKLLDPNLEVQITLYNLRGSLVHNWTGLIGDFDSTLHLNNKSSGSYILKIQSLEQTTTQIIKIQ